MANLGIGILGVKFILFGLGRENLPTSNLFIPRINPKFQKSVVGSIIKLDARASTDPAGNLPKYIYWAFKEIPIGSQVLRYGFTPLENDDSIVSFTPDVTGFYRIELAVGDDFFNSETTDIAEVNIQVIMVPHNQGLVPDASFIWKYLSDFWKTVKDRKTFEIIWSAVIQIVGNEFLNLYQIDYNKSIKDVQDYFQKKWVSYNPRLDLIPEQCSAILADDQAGTRAFTSVLGVAIQPDYTDSIRIVKADGDFQKTSYGSAIAPGRVIQLNKVAYQMRRAAATTFFGLPVSIFIALEKNIQANFSNIPWRFGPTFINNDIDFLALGVQPKDLIVVEVKRLGTEYRSTLKFQVVSVTKHAIGFVYNRDDLVVGRAAGGLSDEDQLTLARDLRITGLTKDLAGNLLYSDEALAIKNIITSVNFKRSNYETELSHTKTFTIGTLSFSITPKHIIRNSKLPLDDQVMAIPALQEYIQQPNIVKVGSTLNKLIDDFLYPIPHAPIVKFENLDYTIDSTEILSVKCDIVSGNAKIFIRYGDLIDKGVSEGDLLIIDQGPNSGFYTIKFMIDQEDIVVWPIPPNTEKSRIAKIRRKVAGKFIRFVEDQFTIHNPAPEELWAEVTYINNNYNVQNNFGVLVGVSKEQSDRQGIKAPYKAALAGLMFAFTRGPTINDLTLGAQILLGLPFTYEQGIIIEIDQVYSTRDDLSPYFGRILIDSVDKHGKKTGVTNIYLYPRGKQIFNILTNQWEDQDPDFSGIAINRATGLAYQVGDFVGQFEILSKGVQIDDYLTQSEWYQDILKSADITTTIRKYHLAYLRANVDIFGDADLDFAGQFIKRVKPHYVDLKVLALKSFEDNVIVTDELKFKPIYTFADDIGLSVSSAIKEDVHFNGPEYLSIDGIMYSRYIYGDDLVTAFGSNTLTSQAGGFVTARVDEFHDSPFIRPGDLCVIHEGPNVGRYVILSVGTDQAITVIFSGKFMGLLNQRFSIYRPIVNPIWGSNTATVTIGIFSPNVTFSTGGFSAGIAVGDVLIFSVGNNPSRKYYITEINGVNAVVHTPVIEPFGVYSFRVYREGLLTKAFGLPPNLLPYSVTLVNGSPWVQVAPGSQLIYGLVKPGDTLYVGVIPYRILDFDEFTSNLYVTPTPSVDLVTQAAIHRTYLPNTPLTVDPGDHFIEDTLALELKTVAGGYTAGLASGSTTVTFATDNLIFNNILPGDFFRPLNGMSSTADFGYGPGMFPIAKITAFNVLETTRPMQHTENQALYTFTRVRSIRA